MRALFVLAVRDSRPYEVIVALILWRGAMLVDPIKVLFNLVQRHPQRYRSPNRFFPFQKGTRVFKDEFRDFVCHARPMRVAAVVLL